MTTEINSQTIQNMTISEIGNITLRDWSRIVAGNTRRPSFYFTARPYLEAFLDINQVNVSGTYGYDSIQGIVLYFITNTSSWKSEMARIVKEELKRRLRENGYKIR